MKKNLTINSYGQIGINQGCPGNTGMWSTYVQFYLGLGAGSKGSF